MSEMILVEWVLISLLVFGLVYLWMRLSNLHDFFWARSDELKALREEVDAELRLASCERDGDRRSRALFERGIFDIWRATGLQTCLLCGTLTRKKHLVGGNCPGCVQAAK